jgi:hypothetical protein
LFLRRVIRLYPEEEVGTWDCGYVLPHARIQYTASSFAQMIVELFSWVLLPVQKLPVIRVLFPIHSSYHSHIPDAVMERGLLPLFRRTSEGVERLKIFQSGKLQVYLFYIFVTLMILMLFV